jgi:hypothetical protein
LVGPPNFDLKLKTMKSLLFSLLAIFSMLVTNAQPQSKGEFHKHILKKTDDERRKTKNQEWWNKGVIVFSETDIPRLGTIKEVEPILLNSFEAGQKFTGRVYLTQSLGEYDPKPSMIFYHLFINGKKAETKVVTIGENLPEDEWSSWLIDFPEYFESEWSEMESGKFLCRVECWAAYSEDETTVFVDENDKILASHTEKKGKIKFLASGEFNYLNGESSEEQNEEVVEEEVVIEEEISVDETEEVASTNSSTNLSTPPSSIPENWKEEYYDKNPVYKKPSKECDCNDVGCAELESVENIQGIKNGNSTIFNCVVENQGEIASCETNAIIRIIWNDERENSEFLYMEQKLPAIAPKSRTTIVFKVENLWFNSDEQSFHFIMDVDGNVAETEEMNLAPVNME